MEAEKWSEIKRLFSASIELRTAEREELLASTEKGIRTEVEKMLAADPVELFNFSPFSRSDNAAAFERIPEKIGSYKVLREIGRGGMGAVYEAVRDDGAFNQKVAVKIISREINSTHLRRHFLNERQILAELSHPNIAYITDGGVSADGIPFFAMEYVKGVPINEFYTQNKLSSGEKLELFRKVCAAVSYAHNQLIVHRDLKPSNILVMENGEPKLLDFGIAKLLDQEPRGAPVTVTNSVMMTPAYASPEQLRGEKISTATDVYSLGVILYEMLAGHLPFKIEGKNFGEILEMVSSSAPPKPSGLTRKTAPLQTPRGIFGFSKLLKNDLDVIVLKAIQKEPARRYRSVEQFSEDLRRHLQGLPIIARPDTVSYRFGKFVKRNKIAAASVALVFASLFAGLTIAVYQARQAQIERVRAEKRFDEVRELANNVVFKYHDAIADIQGTTAVREMMVRDALKYLDNLSAEAENDADLKNELALAYLKLGDVQGKLYNPNTGDSAGAKMSYQKASALLEAIVEEEPENVGFRENLIKAYDNAVFQDLRTGVTNQTSELAEKNLRQLTELQKLDPSTDRRLQLAELYIRLGDVAHFPENLHTDLSKKTEYHLQALAVFENYPPSDADDYLKTAARIYQRLGSDYLWTGNKLAPDNADEAGKMYRKSLEFDYQSLQMTERMNALQVDSAAAKRYLSASYNNLAESLAYNGNFDKAIDYAAKNFDLAQEVARADPNNKEAEINLSESYGLYAKIYSLQKNYAKCLEFSQKDLALNEKILQNDPSNKEVEARIKALKNGIAQNIKKAAEK